ncbi:MAG: polysaccharide biosynthesis/export family protein [Planctomycetaceae bacterium]
MRGNRRIHCGMLCLFAAACLPSVGCISSAHADREVAEIVHSSLPRELNKVTMPVYRVAAPDILLIEAVNNIRPEFDRLRAGDELVVRLGNPEPFELTEPPADPEFPPSQLDLLQAEYELQFEVRDKIIDGPYRIQPDGHIDLGPVYGSVPVEGLTVRQAEQAIAEHLTRYTVSPTGEPTGLVDPQVSVTLANVLGRQPISGEHLVRQDGTISLGIYGSVSVAGLTLEEIKYTVEAHLSHFVHHPEVQVDVLAYNSKVYYVVIDGGGFGERVVRLPITGNETVLDAISNVEGLSEVSSKKLWLARPGPPGLNCGQILPIHWTAIAAEGITTTNYQLLPGDRIYIQADEWIHFDNFVAKVTSPIERIFGFILLGHGTVRALQFGHLQGGGGGFGGGGFSGGF